MMQKTQKKQGMRSVHEHRTRKGNRIFKQPKTKNGKIVGWSKNYIFLVKRNGRQFSFPTGTNKRDAGRLADKIADFLKAPDNSPQMALKRFFPNKYEQKFGIDEKDRKKPTLGDLLEAYQNHYIRDRDRTKREVTQTIRRISAFIQGERKLPRKGRTRAVLEARNKKADSLLAERLTPQKLNSFKSFLLKQAGANEIAKGRARATCNAYMRNAGQLFTNRVVRMCYGELLMPDNPFDKIEKEEEPGHFYESMIDPENLLKQAKRELSRNDPDAFIVFLLALHGGLSNSELDKLLWSQIDLEKGLIRIKTTQFYLPKRRNREAKIRLPVEVVETLNEYREKRKLVSAFEPDFLLPGYGPIAQCRCTLIFRRLSKWLRSKGMTGSKTIYNLRKEAGSFIFAKTGSVDLTAQFLRNDPRTAKEHYIDPGESLVVSFNVG